MEFACRLLCTVQRGLVAAAVATAVSAQTYLECDMFVTEEGPPGRALAFHASSGLPDGVLTTVPAAALLAIHTGGAGQHVLLGAWSGGVREVHRTTGAWIKTFNSTGGLQWAGIYAPGGQVLIGDWATDDVRRYDAVTGNYIAVFGSVPDPADMVFGPNGNLFVCSYPGGVYELNGSTGAFVAWHAQTLIRPNDIVFLPDGRRIVTAEGDNLAHVYDTAWTQLTTFAGTGWGRPHGIDISPFDGHIYVVDGVTTAVHRFHPTTYAETHQAWVLIENKPVDVEFRIPQQICGAVIEIGPGCGGLSIGYAGAPDIGSMLTLRLAGGTPGLPAVLALGDSNQFWNGLPLPFSLTALGAPGCSVLVSQTVALGAAMDGSGNAQLSLAIPDVQGLIDGHVYFQWVAVDPRNALRLSTSGGFDVRIGG